jgi:hypothetical protein
MVPSIALKGSRRNHPIFIINFRLLTSVLGLSTRQRAPARRADTQRRMRADNFGVYSNHDRFARLLEPLRMAQKRHTQSSPSGSRPPSRRDSAQRPNSTERLKRMRDNGWLNFQRSRNPGKGRRTSKECIASLGKSLFLTYLFGWKLSLATNEHGLLSVQKSPIKIDGPKGQRVVRSRDKIGPETTSSEEPQILIEFPPL